MRAVRHAANPTTGIPYWSLERGVVENEAIYLFLHATLGGLVEMDWLIYCAVLRLSLQTSGAWELMRTSMRGSGRIRPGETALFALEAEPGLLSAALWSEAFFVFEISGERRAAPQTISVVIGPGACDPNEGSVTPGPVVINVRNETQRQAIFGILQSPPRAIEHGMLTFWPFLSGKRLLMTQTFRDNFRSEISPVARPCGEWLLSAQPCPSCAFRRRSLQHRIADLPHRALTTVV